MNMRKKKYRVEYLQQIEKKKKTKCNIFKECEGHIQVTVLYRLSSRGLMPTEHVGDYGPRL